MITFDKLWDMLKKRGLSKSKLHTQHNVSKSQLHRLSHNQSVSTNTLDRLCNILQCDIGEISEHFHDDNTF